MGMKWRFATGKSNNKHRLPLDSPYGNGII